MLAVPGMGKTTEERCNSQARAGCETVAPCCLASLSNGPPGRASSPAASGNHGVKIIGASPEAFAKWRRD